MRAPQTRYKVVEQGRRLVTIDTLADEQVGAMPATPMDGPARKRDTNLARPLAGGSTYPLLRFIADVEPLPDGGLKILTGEKYDPAGPRTVRLTPVLAGHFNLMAIVGLVLLLVLIGIAIFGNFGVAFVLGVFLFQLALPMFKKAYVHILNQGQTLE